MPGSVSNGLTVVSLFAGCGGSSLGYRMAGYRELLAVEWDAKASATFRANFPGVPVHEGNICELSGDEALRLAGVAECELDLLDGSPPCQGFSTAGKREFSDGRNRLFEEFARLLRAFRPRAFIMENVSGLRKGKMRLAFAEMTLALKAADYRVSCRELNAWWYGVPQDRRRLIWVGMRNDLGVEPSYPAPTSRRPVTVAEALGEHVAATSRAWGALGGSKRLASWKLAGQAPSATLPMSRAPFVAERHQPQVIEAWHASAPGLSLRKARRHVGSFQSVRLDPGKPSPTQIRAHRNWRWDEPRYLTVAEAKVLQGFPEWFEVSDYYLIGNSVPPPMAEAVGRHVAALLGAADA